MKSESCLASIFTSFVNLSILWNFKSVACDFFSQQDVRKWWIIYISNIRLVVWFDDNIFWKLLVMVTLIDAEEGGGSVWVVLLSRFFSIRNRETDMPLKNSYFYEK